jgi:hypothetical protein
MLKLPRYKLEPYCTLSKVPGLFYSALNAFGLGQNSNNLENAK